MQRFKDNAHNRYTEYTKVLIMTGKIQRNTTRYETITEAKRVCGFVVNCKCGGKSIHVTHIKNFHSSIFRTQNAATIAQ
jgi:hypothetical protein